MNFDVFKNQAFELAKELGFSDYEIYYERGSSLSIKAFEREIEEYENSKNGGVSFRGMYNGKIGSAFSEHIDENTAEYIVQKAFDIANVIEDDDEVYFHDGSGEYATHLKLYSESIEKITNEEKIAYVLKNEKEALDTEKLTFVESYFGESEGEMRIANSRGLDLSEKSNTIYSGVYVIANDGENNYTQAESKVGNSLEELDSGDIVTKAVNKVLDKFYAKGISTQKSKCIIINDAFEGLFGAFLGSFDAESCQKGFSLLADKLGQRIASENITIIDDPHIQDGMASCAFDGEGVATYKKTLVDKGILMTHLHNIKTAKKAGIKSTGNASRGGFKSLIGISPSNCYIEAGEKSYDDLVKEMQKGIIITGFKGMHAGMDGISGDFSLECYGFLVDNETKTPINQMVVSGNLFELFKNIKELANDLKILESSIAAPSVLIEEMSFSGSKE